ncbi:unnamed protein product, partial [Effrenium voratum]
MISHCRLAPITQARSWSDVAPQPLAVLISACCHPPLFFAMASKVRTTADAPVAPEEAMKLLKEGNDRFVKGAPQATRTNEAMRK